MKTIATLVFALCGLATMAQSRFNVLSLAIGNAHYEADVAKLAPDFNGLGRISAATESARRFNALLSAGGAKATELLLSAEDALLTRDRILGEIDGWVARCKKDTIRNKLLVLYYCGHGLTNENYTPYLPPGDLSHMPAPVDTADWRKSTVAVYDLIRKLDRSKLPYMLFLDCCLDDQARTPREYFGKSNPGTVGGVFSVNGLRDMSRMGNNVDAIFKLTGEWPVIAAVSPGKIAKVRPYDFADGRRQVGPLCAIVHEAINVGMADQKAISLLAFTEHLVAKDPVTAKPRAVVPWCSGVIHPDGSTSTFLRR